MQLLDFRKALLPKAKAVEKEVEKGKERVRVKSPLVLRRSQSKIVASFSVCRLILFVSRLCMGLASRYFFFFLFLRTIFA